MARDSVTDAREQTAAAPFGASVASSTFRRDIQGLRAVAVLSVALNHANISLFSGGFVGVDVFFVISGFLITQLLLNEAQRSGRIRLSNFYSRRARRILPAATVVIVSTLAASAALLNYVHTAAIVKDSIWATFFAANIKFSRDQTDYFAADDPASPLQHFWSLAVEEQFYLVWPLLLVCLVGGYALWRRRRKGARRSATSAGPTAPPVHWILGTLTVIAGASLVWSVVLTHSSPTAAYFSTFARVWELAAGAACAVLLPVLSRLPLAVRTLSAWAGFVAILAAVVSYDATTRFPGYAALLPVLGAALVIAGGSGKVRGGPTSLLQLKPFQLLGNWSYSFYLWHWPFLLIPETYVGHTLSLAQNLLLLLAALAVSVATYHLVENPFRRSARISARPRRGLLLYPAAISLSLIGCVFANQVVQEQVASASSAPAITVHNFGDPGDSGVHLSSNPRVALVQASVEASLNDVAIPGDLSPAVLDLRTDIPGVGECDYTHGFDQLCERGDVGSDKVMVTIGDSHAREWIPALDTIAKRDGYAIYYLVKPGCDAAQIVPDYGGGGDQGCLNFRAWAMDQIADLHPDVVVLANDVPPGVTGTDGELTEDNDEVAQLFREGLQETITMLQGMVGRTIVLGDAPGVPELPSDCLAARDATLGDCAFPRSERSILMFDAAREAAQKTGVDFVSPIRWFCAKGLCPLVVGSTITYRDTEHITATYARELARPLEKALDLAAP